MTETEFFGGSAYVSFGSGGTLIHRHTRCWILRATASNPSATLPDARIMKPGGPSFCIINFSTSAFTIRINSKNSTSSPGNVLDIAKDKAALVYLQDNSTEDGQWYAMLLDRRTS